MKLRTSILGAGLVAILVTSGCAVAPKTISEPNKLILTINSKPIGARIYEGREYLGTTPLNISYTLNNSDYNRGSFYTKKLIIVKDGYLPTTKKLGLEVEDNWRNVNGREFHRSYLFLLKNNLGYFYKMIAKKNVKNKII